MTNSKQTKRALISSVMTLLLCFTMLLGTTFAWFTDNASTSVNTIQAGTLDVALEMKENGEWVSAEGKTLSFTENYWEPGCTYSLPELRIKNSGNLALKYKVAITGIQGDAKLNDVIDWTVSDVAMGTEQSLAVGATNEFTISGHMKEFAGNEYQGMSIEGIAVTVYATQYTVETDGTGSNQYDNAAKYAVEVKTIEELREAIKVSDGSTTIVLAADIEIGDDELEVVDTAKNGKGMLLINKDTVIDLNGKTLAYTGGTNDGCWYIFYVKNAALTIIDSSGDNSGKVYGNDPDGTWAVMIREASGGTVNIYGGHYMSKDGAPVYTNNGDINIYGGLFETEKSESKLLYMGNYSGSINIYGGAYKNYNPEVNAIRNIKVVDGYKVESSTIDGSTWYQVVAE